MKMEYINLIELRKKLNNDKEIKKLKKEYKELTGTPLKIVLLKWDNNQARKYLDLDKYGYKIALVIESYYTIEIAKQYFYKNKKSCELKLNNIVFDYEDEKKEIIKKIKKATDDSLKIKQAKEKLGYLR